MLGLWLGLRRFAGDVADPILGTLYSIPKITLYPIILLIFGLGVSAKVAFGVIHGILPIAIFTMNAVRNVAPVYRRTALMMRLSPAIPWRRCWRRPRCRKSSPAFGSASRSRCSAR